MAGIDNNTLLYLKGDSFTDSSLTPKTILNSGVTIDNSGKFEKSFNLTNGWLKITDTIFTDLCSNDFTIDWWENYSSTGAGALFTTNVPPINDTTNYIKGFVIHKDNKVYATSKSNSTAFDVINGVTMKDYTSNTWVHWAFVKYGNTYSMYKNGKLFSKTQSETKIMQMTNGIGLGIYCNNAQHIGYGSNISEFRISNIARYTTDFTPPTQPYNSITINTLSQTATSVNFSVTKLGQEVINKVEVLQDGLVKATHTDSYDNLTYNFEGSNDVTIRVTYDDNYTEEKVVKVGNSKAKIYLYKEGNECTSLTGGYSLGYVAGVTPTLTKETSYMKLVGNGSTSGSNGRITTMNSINTSYYNNLKCIFSLVSSAKAGVKFGITSGRNDSTFINGINTTEGSQLYNNEELLVSFTDIQRGFISIGCGGVGGNNFDLRVNTIWLETKENALTINSQTQDNVTFSANDLGLVTISKIDVLINGKLSQTYTDTYSNLTYRIDKSLLGIGNNKIEIRATYSQGDGITETVSEYLTHTYTVENLHTSSNLIQVFDRQEVLNNSLKLQKDNLRNILSSKNVEVSESDKMSNLIDKVNSELIWKDWNKLWLYNEGKENSQYPMSIITVTDSVDSGTVNNFVCEKKDSYIQSIGDTTPSSARNRNFVTESKIDLTNFSKIYVDCSAIVTGSSSSSSIFIYVQNARDKVASVANTRIVAQSTNVRNIYSLDISSLSGTYYVGTYLSINTVYSQNVDLKVYKIWLEK